MDGNSVKEEPSEPETLTDLFVRLCPQYMLMGMSYNEFWNSNTSVHRAYRETYELRREQEEWGRWRLGAYFYSALLCVAPAMNALKPKEPSKYLKEPFPVTAKEAHERDERDHKINFEKMLAKLNRESNEELKRQEQERLEVSENGDN